MLSGPLFWIVITVSLIVFAVLTVGVVGFARGGEFNRKYGNKIMQLRILMQFIAVVLILLFVYFAQS